MRYRNHESFGFPIGMAAGALLAAGMLLLFGRGGARRRSLIRDKVRHYGRFGWMQGRKAARNAAHHAVGTVEEMKASWRDSRRQFDDDILVSRVRAQIGRDVQNIRLLDIAVDSGQQLVISGPVLHGEAEKLRERMRKVRGVRDFRIEVTEHSRDQIERISGVRGFGFQRQVSGF